MDGPLAFCLDGGCAHSATHDKLIVMNDLDFIQSPEAVPAIAARTEALKFSMASEPRTGALLRVLAASKPSGRFLELGTGTGMATAWLLAGMDADSKLTSVDTNLHFQRAANEVLGCDSRLNLVLEDAADYLRRQPPYSYDLVFADAIRGKYEVLDEALATVKLGGFYVIDDMLPQPNWPEGHGEKASALLMRLVADERFQLVPMAWASGIVVMVRALQSSTGNGK